MKSAPDTEQDTEPTSGPPLAPAPENLTVRIVSASLLAVIALAVTWIGGLVFALLVGLAAMVVFWEWNTLTRNKGFGLHQLLAYGAILVAAIGCGMEPQIALLGVPAAAAAGIVLALSVAYLAYGHEYASGAPWPALGLVYAGGAVIAMVLTRQSASHGLAAIIWLFALVWGTDIAAYFCGRAVGGPKLWQRVSPNKTWSGFFGGIAAGASAGTLAVLLLVGNISLSLFAFSLFIAAVSQGGDLFESSLKRRFGAKDSSALIPGHGGLMDRLDALIAAAIVAFLAGVWRRGVTDVGTGLLVW